jgi:hypothetical protein
MKKWGLFNAISVISNLVIVTVAMIPAYKIRKDSNISKKNKIYINIVSYIAGYSVSYLVQNKVINKIFKPEKFLEEFMETDKEFHDLGLDKTE